MTINNTISDAELQLHYGDPSEVDWESDDILARLSLIDEDEEEIVGDGHDDSRSVHELDLESDWSDDDSNSYGYQKVDSSEVEIDSRLARLDEMTELTDDERERYAELVKSGAGVICDYAYEQWELRLSLNYALNSKKLEKHRELLEEILGQIKDGGRINIHRLALQKGASVSTLQGQWARAMLLMRQELSKLEFIQQWCDETRGAKAPCS